MAGPVHYHTDKFPPADLEWKRLIPLIGPANAALARYDALLSAMPNASVLLSPLTTQEAVLSSRIEGTQATMGEVLEYEAESDSDKFSPERQADIQEVLNYRRALRHAESMLERLPLSQRVMREAHRVLLAEVRGQGRAPGEFRRLPNWIGPPGGTIEEARFVPIAADKLPEAMGAWEKFMHSEAPDRLVQLAILHAEFEALHPFLDGNGRLGRMLVPLFLFQKELLHAPMFYVSEYLESNRQEYYDRLLAVSRDNDWTGWCEFFLRVITIQALSNEVKARKILVLYEDKKVWMVSITHSQYSIAALDFVFSQPIFSSSHFIQASRIPAPTARRILRLCAQHGLLRTLREASGRRPTVFAFPELLNIAEGRDIL
jgi:Fic family protein